MPRWSLSNGRHVGTVLKTHSYLGSVRVAFLFEGLDEVIEPESFIFINWNEKPVPYRVENITWNNDTEAALKLEGVNTDLEAKKLVGREIFVEGTEVPLVEEPVAFPYEGFLVIDLISGKELGRVTDYFDNGKQELIQVTTHAKEFLVPLVKDLVKKIEKRKMRMYVDLPDGLIDL